MGDVDKRDRTPLPLRAALREALHELGAVLEGRSEHMTRTDLVERSGRLLFWRIALPLCVAMWATVAVLLLIDAL